MLRFGTTGDELKVSGPQGVCGGGLTCVCVCFMFNKGNQVSTWLHTDRKRATPVHLQRKSAEPLHCCQATFSTLDCSLVSWRTLSSDFPSLKATHDLYFALCLLFLLAGRAVDGYTGPRCAFLIPSCHNAL